MDQRISAGLGLALITIFSSAVGILILTNGKTFAINESTKETSKSQHLDATQLVGKNTRFDSCGKIDKYLGEPWYRNVTQSLSDNGQSAIGILDVCQSIDKTFVIILTNGGSSDGLIPYCDAGALYQYDVVTGFLKKALFDDKDRGCVAWPSEFGKRNDNIILLQGFGGDAGCRNTMNYEYHFIENKMELKNECSQCQGESHEACLEY